MGGVRNSVSNDIGWPSAVREASHSAVVWPGFRAVLPVEDRIL